MLMENLGGGWGGRGKKKGIMGDLQVAYTNFLRGWYSSPTSDNPHQQVEHWLQDKE